MNVQISDINETRKTLTVTLDKSEVDGEYNAVLGEITKPHGFGASPGREAKNWLDILLWGHQITLQHRPAEVLPLAQQGKRHFGVVLPWIEWEREARRIKAVGVAFLEEPAVLMEGTQEEQAKFYLHDPSHNVIEVKAYRNVHRTLGLAPGREQP